MSQNYLHALDLTLGILLSFLTLVFLIRLILTWYPKVDLNKGFWLLIAIPTSSILNIENNSHSELEISIFDINGKTIFKSHSGNSTIQIDIKNNASGIYFLKLTSEAKSSIYKFVKE